MSAKGGPRSKLTPSIATAIVRAIRAGVPYRFAAMNAGVGERTLFRWLTEGRKSSTRTPERQLWQRVEKALAAAVAERVRRIGKAGRRNWKADAWWLERMAPDHFAADKRELADVRKELTAVQAELATLRANGAGGPQARTASNPPGGPPSANASGQPSP